VLSEITIDPQERIQELEDRLEEAEQTLRALRNGEVDAVLAWGPGGDRVYTLKGADEAYRSMVQNMAEGALTVAPDGLILFSNDQFAATLEVPLDEVIGFSLYDFLQAEDAPALSGLLADAAGAKVELWLKKGPTALLPAQVSARRLQLDGMECVCLIVTDLTEQKHNQELVAADRLLLQYRRLVDNLPDVAWTSDVNGHLSYISPNVEALYGFTPEEICGGGADLTFGHVHPDDVGRVTQGMRALFAEHQPFDVELRTRRKDGQWIWLHCRASQTFERDGSVYADGVLSDITVRKRAELAVQQEKDFNQTLIDSLPGLFYVIDEHGQILRWNRTFEGCVRLLRRRNLLQVDSGFIQGTGEEPGCRTHAARLFSGSGRGRSFHRRQGSDRDAVPVPRKPIHAGRQALPGRPRDRHHRAYPGGGEAPAAKRGPQRCGERDRHNRCGRDDSMG